MVLAHGVHQGGIDEPRFTRFAAALSRQGVAVLTPALPALSEYKITGDSVDIISAAVMSLSQRADLARAGKVGLIGISFGGGLALVAASMKDVGQHLEYVTSVGGHHDLHRVLRFLMTDLVETPNGPSTLDAHEYGAALLVHRYLHHLSPAVDVAPLRACFRSWIAEDRASARAHAAQLRSSRAKELFSMLESGTMNELSTTLLPLIDSDRDELRALSPRGKLGSIHVPVYLLHGKSDRVIPNTELWWSVQELNRERKAHRSLVTSLIEHVMPDRPAGLFEKLALVDFMSAML